MKTNIITLAILVTLFACNTNEKEQEAIITEVIATHDEVMPKLGELEKVARKLSSLADSLSADSTQATLIKMLQHQSGVIKDANESMMVWMRQYDGEYSKKVESHADVMKYLNDQLTKINKVRDDMNNTLEAGRDLLQNARKN
jgi:predicted  nucleic acid-binding Zn-ribbon protein